MELLQRIQVHFEQKGQTYLLVGTLFTAAYTVRSRWGTVAMLCFTVTAVGSYPYLRKQVTGLLNRNLDAKVPALFSVAISVVSIFSPALGVCLGALMGGSFLLRDWTVSDLLKKGEEGIKRLEDQNQQLEKIAEEMKGKVDALQVEMDRLIALAAQMDKTVSVHLQTQGILASTDTQVDNQFERLEAKLEQLVSLGKVIQVPEGGNKIGSQVEQTVDACEALVKGVQNDRVVVRALLEKVQEKAK